jgi:hypothetical protein
MKYTEPRYTKDLDIWVEPTSENAQRAFAALKEFGAPLTDVTPERFHQDRSNFPAWISATQNRHLDGG